MNNESTKLTILIIDDSPTNLEVLYSALIDYGYEILVEMDGCSGIEQAEDNRPDLILLDVMMPGIDGFETCRRLKDNYLTKDIPIIFMTALNDTIDKVTGLKLGAVDYITKPFQHEEIIARIQVHLQLRQVTLELEEQKQLLEVKVEERTAQLTQTLAELKQAQLKLVQTEKMSSLGQLVAGIAHEVNNPINFIYGNLVHINYYSQGLINLIRTYQEKYPGKDDDIDTIIEDIDLDFLIDDLPKTVSSMKFGVDRIREIVASLRSFSRLDEASIKSVDIHEGIESTLLILQHRIKEERDTPAIGIIKDYGDLPQVECYAGQLNQVFMNLLSNAIDAVEEGVAKQRDYSKSRLLPIPCIRISTKFVDGWIAIHIADNGMGIKNEIQQKIFDPFFTTKPVGKGAGLGLSVSYQIIMEKHKGNLSFCSQPGEGTEFVIKIPQKQYHYATENKTQKLASVPVK